MQVVVEMDKFVIKVNKNSATDDESDHIESCAEKQPAPKRRKFNPDWTNSYFFILDNDSDSPRCLICSQSVSELHVGKIQRHFETRHGNIAHNYPAESEKRRIYLSSLQRDLVNQKKAVKCFLGEQDTIVLAGLKICWRLLRCMKPFTDIEIVKDCMIDAAEVLTKDIKEGEKIMSRFRSLPLSDSTMQRRALAIASHFTDRLRSKLLNCICFSLALDESTDVSDLSQLCVWVRFVNSDFTVEDELLGIRAMHGRTRGADILCKLEEILSDYKLPKDKLISVSTDGAPNMTGVNVGLVALLKETVPQLIGFHCIIHQEALCAKISSQYLISVMDSVIAIVNFIRGNALNHREFVDFAGDDVILHTDIRWLSKGKVLDRFISLLPKINEFLDCKKVSKFDGFLCDVKWVRTVSFLADITKHLNDLNRQLQGNKRDISYAAMVINAFIVKLQRFREQMSTNDLLHFEQLHLSVQQQPQPTLDVSDYLQFLDQLQKNFASRFVDFNAPPVIAALEFYNNAYSFDINKSHLLGHLFTTGFDRASFEAELLEFQCGPKPDGKLNFATIAYASFQFIAARMLSILPSTYLCETTFSNLTNIKSTKRSLLTDPNVEACVICAVTNMLPDFETVMKDKQWQASH